jgi:hypothetical protein
VRGRLLLPALAVALWLSARPAAADRPASKTQQTEELRDAVVARLRAAVGTDVRIRDVRYEMLSSTFVAAGVEIGPRDAPYVRLPAITIELALLSSASALTVANLRASGARVAIPAAWIERPPRFLGRRPVAIRSGKITRAMVTLATAGGGKIILRDVALTLVGIEVVPPGGGKDVRLKGTLALTASRIEIAGCTLEQIELRVRLAGEQIKVTRLSAGGADATMLLAGNVGFKGGRIGAVELTGTVDAALSEGARISGKLSLKGPTPTTLTLDVKLQSQGMPPRSGGVDAAPLLNLRGRIGARRLRGTLGGWQLR